MKMSQLQHSISIFPPKPSMDIGSSQCSGNSCSTSNWEKTMLNPKGSGET